MRHLLLPAAVIFATAALVAACGGSARPPVGGGGTPRSHRRAPPTAAEIRRAAALTATAPGYSAQISASVRLTALGAGTVTATGSGHFDPRSHSGTLTVTIRLPGLLGASGPLPTQVIVSGSEAYVKVPASLTHQFPRHVLWLRQSMAGLGLGLALDPAEILRDSAQDATGHVNGQRAHITIDPRDGRVRTVALQYGGRGYRVSVMLRFTGFGAEVASPKPPSSEVASFAETLKGLGL